MTPIFDPSRTFAEPPLPPVPEEPVPPTLSEAAESGDERAQLEALRRILAKAIDNCASLRDLASLSNRYQDVLRQIKELPSAVEESKTEKATSGSKSRRAKKE